MKQIIIAITITLAGTMALAQDRPSDLVPKLKLGDNTELQVWGWTHLSYTEDRAPQDYNLDEIRLRSQLQTGQITFFTDIDIIGEDDWLRQVWVSYDIDPDDGAEDPTAWKLRLGRVLVAAGYTTPPPFHVETASYPLADPFSYYAWGVQIEGRWSDGWSLIVDVTGATGETAFSEDIFDHIEASARIEKAFQNWAVAGTTQLSEDSLKIALDASTSPNDQVNLRGALYYARNTDDRVSDHFGAYVFGAYRPVKWFELHGMLDHRQLLSKSWTDVNYGIGDDGQFFREEVAMQSPGTTTTRLVPGLRFFIGDNIDLTIDGVIPIDGEMPSADPSIQARVRIKF